MIALSHIYRCPKTVELWGLGPSLDTSRLGAHHPIAINETVLLGVNVDGFVWDHGALGRIVATVRQRYGTLEHYFAPNLYIQRGAFEKSLPHHWMKHAHFWDLKEVKAAGVRVGTACVALLACADAGVKTVHLHGFDTFWEMAADAGDWRSIPLLDSESVSSRDDYGAVSDALSPLGRGSGRLKGDPPKRYGKIAVNMAELALKHGMDFVEG